MQDSTCVLQEYVFYVITALIWNQSLDEKI